MEFASPPWLDFFCKLLFAKTSLNSEDAVAVACEVYTDVPGHLPSKNGRIAWTRRISAAGISLTLEECRDVDADLKTVGDYKAFRELARMPLSEENLVEFGILVDRFVKEGRIVSVRDNRTSRPAPDFAFHNYVAMLTA